MQHNMEEQSTIATASQSPEEEEEEKAEVWEEAREPRAWRVISYVSMWVCVQRRKGNRREEEYLHILDTCST